MPGPCTVHPRGFRKKSAVFVAASLSVLAQVPGSRYEGLKHALGLTDSQVWQLQHRSPEGRILNDSQQAKLTAIERVLDRSELASLAITIGFIDIRQWPGGPLCHYPIHVYASELNLSDSQVERLERLRQASDIKPRRDPALSALDDTQKAKLAAFETAVHLASEGVELGLIPRSRGGELLCH